LARVARKRLRNFLRYLPQVLSSEDPQAVHRTRVSSRRVEEDIATLFKKPYPKKARRLRKTLKRIRRDLGGWRNCDVVLALLEKKRRRLRGESLRAAWSLAERYVGDERRREIDRARRKVDQQDFPGLAARLEKLLTDEADDIAPLTDAIATAQEQWRASLSVAEKSRADDDLHAFRIATKKLRYRLELGRALGLDSAPLLKRLKHLQRVLGHWHDREMFDHMTAEAIARPKVLLRRATAARAVLRELEKDGRRQAAAVEESFRVAREIRQTDRGE